MEFIDKIRMNTFIQSYTRHDCLPLNIIKLISCLYLNAAFRLDFLYVNPILFNRFLRVLLQTLIPVSLHLLCIYFDIFFSYFQGILLRVFYSDALIIFLVYQFSNFSFSSPPHFFYICSKFCTLKQPMYFATLHCGLPS